MYDWLIGSGHVLQVLSDQLTAVDAGVLAMQPVARTLSALDAQMAEAKTLMDQLVQCLSDISLAETRLSAMVNDNIITDPSIMQTQVLVIFIRFILTTFFPSDFFSLSYFFIFFPIFPIFVSCYCIDIYYW